jgi:hypothetical protein
MAANAKAAMVTNSCFISIVDFII